MLYSSFSITKGNYNKKIEQKMNLKKIYKTHQDFINMMETGTNTKYDSSDPKQLLNAKNIFEVT